MKKFNLLLAVALITLTAAIVGCGKDDQNNSVVPGAPGYGAYQYPPQNCVNGVCSCLNGMTYQNTGTNGYCQPGQGWDGFNTGNPCYAYYGPYAQPTYVYGQLVCVLNQNQYNNSWNNRCQTYNYGAFWYYTCTP